MKVVSAISRKPKNDKLPELPLRELVLFPHTLVSITILEKDSIAAVEEALRRESPVFAVTMGDDDPSLEIAGTGTVARIAQQMRMPDRSFRLVLEGLYRGERIKEEAEKGFLRATVRPIPPCSGEPTPDVIALMRALKRSFGQYSELIRKIQPESIIDIQKEEDPEKLSDLVSHALIAKPSRKLPLLAAKSGKERLRAVLEALEMEIEVVGLQRKISGRVKTRMDKTQRDYILNEQIKEIHRELGQSDEEDELKLLEQALEGRQPPAEVLDKARKEFARLRKLQSFSPEAGVLRGYLEWLVDLPWNEETEDRIDLTEAARILDEDHFGMKKAKERILEYIAVRDLSDSIRGPILCLVGPPGTGKTSLARSVARSLGRNFVSFSLGGLRDEAEIRGHRKTYVGALPGKILQSMKKAHTINPVFLLDEIDKLASDYRGDPASALLEVLDPEQNRNFTDHYLELPYDLSKVLFIATANSLHTIPYPLLDRMEVIEIPGYGEREKLAIARKYLIPKTIRENGLEAATISFVDEAVLAVIRSWTMESGVRSLEREIARCTRRLAREAVEKGYRTKEKPLASFRRRVSSRDLPALLGRRRYRQDLLFKDSRVGVANGLAWTEYGGTILPIETIGYDGKGELLLTGNLGDVMKESARTALSYLRSQSGRYPYGIEAISSHDFHIHVPEGAIPKDGPSAGVALATALISLLLARAPKSLVAMTGELTLTGRVLAIGGLKEKLLAAIRSGMQEVIIPKANGEELGELGKEITGAIHIREVETAPEAFAILFEGLEQNA